jgi:DNA-binding transcriptional MocR family regulator
MWWAKTRAQARFNLASSGLANYPLARLSLSLEDLELSGDSYYGYAPLQKRLAERLGADASSIVAVTGTSMANHLAMAAIIEPGDEILIEYPTYELLLSTAQYLGASVRIHAPF